MDHDARTRMWIVVSVVGLVFLALGLGYLRFSDRTTKKPQTVATPLLPVISVCKEVTPGMNRIGARPGGRYMVQFDVPVKSVSVHEGDQDMPPFAYGFAIRPQAGGESFLEISYGPQRNWPDVDRKRAASARIVKQIIVDDQGRSVGEDDWGYLDPDRRWRRTRFQGWVEAEYGFVSGKDTDLFDEIIKSACLQPSPSARQTLKNETQLLAALAAPSSSATATGHFEVYCDGVGIFLSKIDGAPGPGKLVLFSFMSFPPGTIGGHYFGQGKWSNVSIYQDGCVPDGKCESIARGKVWIDAWDTSDMPPKRISGKYEIALNGEVLQGPFVAREHFRKTPFPVACEVKSR